MKQFFHNENKTFEDEMKKNKFILALVAMALLVSGTAFGGGLIWRNHQAPFDFLFGNHIDSHQQTMVKPNGELLGYFYIEFTGEFTPEGYPIAQHTNCNAELAECTIGWQWRGIPGQATFVYHESGDLPLWLTNYRADIPQPGGFSHFHWLGNPLEAMDLMTEMPYEGYFLELTAKETFVFKHGNEEILVKPGLDLATHLNIVPIFPILNGGNEDNGASH